MGSKCICILQKHSTTETFRSLVNFFYQKRYSYIQKGTWKNLYFTSKWFFFQQKWRVTRMLRLPLTWIFPVHQNPSSRSAGNASKSESAVSIFVLTLSSSLIRFRYLFCALVLRWNRKNKRTVRYICKSQFMFWIIITLGRLGLTKPIGSSS